MSTFKIMMIVNSANENVCEYLPNDSSQNLINEIHEVANTLKNIPLQGSIKTNQNKFCYRTYINKGKNVTKEEDKLVIFICCDLKYNDNLISKFFDEALNSLDPDSYKNNKLNPENKKKIAKIFYKYQDSNNIEKEIQNWNNYNLEYGTLKEFTTLDIDARKASQSISIYGLIDSSIDDRDGIKINRGMNSEVKIQSEASKVKKWKTLKCIFLFINIIMIILAFFFCLYIIRQPENY